MKVKIHTTIFIIILGLTLALQSCDSFLDEEPSTQIHKDGVYNSIPTSLGALNGCYASMAGYNAFSYRYYHVLNSTSGLGVSIKANDRALTQLRILANDNNIETLYDAQYSTISVANDIIDGMKNSTIEDVAVKNRIIGEATFIRGVNYFNLVRQFGRVILFTKPVETFDDAHLPREEIDIVYKQIISDFEESFEMLPEAGDEEIGRPHKYAAKAMLAKVYLTLAGDNDGSPYWQQAYNEAKEVYDANVYDLVYPFSDVFGAHNKNTIESIFEIQFGALQGGSRLTEMTFVLGHPLLPNSTGGKSWGKTRPTKTAFDLFHEEDPRRDITFAHTKYHNILETTNRKKNVTLYPTGRREGNQQDLFYKQGDSEYAAWIKYVDPSFTTVSNANFVYYRYADLLLVLAEAANEIGKKDEAGTYLNLVLDRARSGDGSSTSVYPLAIDTSLESKESLREIILNERLIELSGEADEWYTIRRKGATFLKKIIDIHNERVSELFGDDDDLPRFVYYIPASDEDIKRNMLLPFPNNEISRNEKISDDDQNYGY